MSDTPFYQGGEGWRLHLPAGRAVAVGPQFDALEGYRLYIRFTDSRRVNLLSPASARAIAETLSPSEQGDVAELRGLLLDGAQKVERLNQGWRLAGCPTEPLMAGPGGRA